MKSHPNDGRLLQANPTARHIPHVIWYSCFLNGRHGLQGSTVLCITTSSTAFSYEKWHFMFFYWSTYCHKNHCVTFHHMMWPFMTWNTLELKHFCPHCVISRKSQTSCLWLQISVSLCSRHVSLDTAGNNMNSWRSFHLLNCCHASVWHQWCQSVFINIHCNTYMNLNSRSRTFSVLLKAVGGGGYAQAKGCVELNANLSMLTCSQWHYEHVIFQQVKCAQS